MRGVFGHPRSPSRPARVRLPRPFRRSDERGVVAVMAGLLVPIMVGGLAVAVDGAWWRYRQDVLQNAADAAALSLATDVANGTTALATLTVNGRNEARKNGCTTNCNVSVTYNSGTGIVTVTATDPSATRFMSGFYSTQAQQLTGRASARVVSAGGGSSSFEGSSCVLAVEASAAPGINITSSDGTPGIPRTVVQGCELTTNSTASNSVQVQGARVLARVTTSGQANLMWMSEMAGGVQVGRPATPNPYATRSLMQPGNTASAISQTQFPTNAYGNPWIAYQAGECIEPRNTGWTNPLPLNFGNGDLSSVIPDAAARGYSYSFTGGKHVHTFGGGGGRFCAVVNLNTNQVLNLGAGAWFFNFRLHLQEGELYGTDTTPTPISSMIPRLAGQVTNGVTLVIGEQSFTQGGRYVMMDVRAPTSGPLQGLAVVTSPDRVGNIGSENVTVPDDTSGIQSTFRWRGLMYIPNRQFISTSTVTASVGPDGTAATGCMQLVARSLTIHRPITFANNCAGMGLATWGTDSTQGWNPVGGGGGGSGTGLRARLVAN